MEARPERLVDAAEAVSTKVFDIAGLLLIMSRNFADRRDFLSAARPVRGFHFQIPSAKQDKLMRVVCGAAHV
jgi:dTDP-4-dehydrorhamnose 3,5-epimerase-like enzyme